MVVPSEIKTSECNSGMGHMTRMNFKHAIVTPTCSPAELIRLMIDQDVEMKMSALTAKRFFSARAGNTMRSRRMQQGSFMLAVAIVLAVTACAGGAGLNIPIGPVDHACPVENSCAHR